VIAGKYTLRGEVGRGAAGVVWLAVDEALGRQVAMKRIRTGDERAEGRAWREARLAASLHHPHLVAMYDVVEDDDHLWLVMEYVSGGTLRDAIAQAGSYDPDAAGRVGLQIADGLAYAHDAGIVHRDVKPSNILLTPSGQAKLADFGIARGEDFDATVTQTGVVNGSPAYLAPEVAAGGPATALSDSWSLGATLYHAVTGAPPYEVVDNNLVGVLYRIVHDEVPRTERGGWLGPLLDGAMTRDPERRWTIDQIRDFLTAGPPGRTTVERMTVPPPAPAPDPVGVETVMLTAVVAESTARHAALRERPARRPRAAWILAAIAILAAAIFGVAAVEGHLFTSDTSTGGTEASVATFVKGYLATAPTDQSRAFAMLTPSYQQASGGLSGYTSFWSQVAAINSIGAIQVGSGTSQHPTATYTYTYTKRSNAVVTETVTLDLVKSNGSYLIDGATSHR
jgi:hypothetical protein